MFARDPRFGIRFLVILACGLVSLSAAPVFASHVGEVVTVRDGDDGVELGGALRHLADPTGELGWKEVVSRSRADEWRDVEGDIPNLGYSRDVHWFGVRLSSVAHGRDSYLLEIQYPVLDEIVLHVLREGRLERIERAGDRLPFAERDIEHVSFVFPLELAAGETCDLLLRVDTGSAVQVPAMLWTSEAFRDRIDRLYSINGVFYGALLSFMLYGLMVYAVTRNRNQLFFAGYVTAFLALKLAMDGVGYQFLWPRSPYLQDRMIAAALALAGMLELLFACHFLRLKQDAPRLWRLLRTTGLTTAAAFASVWVLPYAVSILPVMMLAVGGTFLVLVVAAHLWRRGSRSALLFGLSWLSLLAGTCVLILTKMGLLAPTLLTDNGVTLGMISQALLMIVAMADDLRTSRRERRVAVEELLRMQEASRRELEEEVARQTRELRDMMRELASVNEELDQSSKLDGLTGIFNRRAFEERLGREYGRALRTRSSLSVLMIDIDKFKDFNDSYGHQVGDECLKRVAGLVEEEVRLTTDFAARYGGEEFSVLLAETPGDGAAGVAERIRAAIEGMIFEVRGDRVPVTVSVGVGCLKPVECERECAQALVAMADKALYEAKDNGRNRVEVCLVIPEAERV